MRKLLASLTLAIAAATAAPALADGFIVLPPSPPEMPHLRNVPMYVREHRVSVKIEGRVAVTQVDETFVNPNPRQLEGTYLFPLPEGATIDRFSMWIDGKEQAAELLDAGKARSIYEGIVRQMRDPALLEYAERGLFKTRIFPIDANGEKRVRIRYAETLSAESGTVAYRYPLNTTKFSSRPLDAVSVEVAVDAGGPVAAVYSPSHRIDAPKDLSGPFKVGFEERNVKPDRDFLLYFRPTRKDVGVAVVAHRDPSDPEGTFLLVLAPRTTENAPAVPKDVVFVVDTSGSMAGAKMEQAKGALRYCLRSLVEGDRFALVPFSTEARPFREALVAATAENRAAAEKFVDGLEAAGGTAIDDALRAGLGMLPAVGADARPAIVLFVTDGLPTIGETDVEAILKHAADRAGTSRVFAFGVGNDVNTRLLDRLATENRGTRDYVAETESIEDRVSSLYAKLAKPAMTDVELRVEGVETSAVQPQRIPDLFHGGEVLVTGRYAKPGSATIRVRGRVRGEVREIVEEVVLPAAETKNEFLPRLWAVRRVGFLLDEIRRRGETAEVRDEVVKLAKRFGIVTPYTSWLILEDDARRGRGDTGAMPPSPLAPATAGGGMLPRAQADEAEALDQLVSEAKRAGAAKEQQSGEGAVGLARENLKLLGFEGDKDDKPEEARAKATTRILRHVAGRTFIARGGVWYDFEADLKRERRTVDAFSDEYFKLAKDHAELAKAFALGDVVLAVGDEVVEVRAKP